MALMLPLMLALLLTCFEGGYFLWNEHKVVKGVRDGARYGGRLSFANFDCGDQTIIDSAQAKIRNLTRTGVISAGGAPVIAGWADGDVYVSLSCRAANGIYDANAGNAPIVIVRAEVPYPTSPLTAIARALGFNVTGIKLNAEAESPVMGL
jgi:hypothetical protein